MTTTTQTSILASNDKIEQSQPIQQVTHSVSSQLLGQAFNPLVRRFNRHLASINFVKPTESNPDPIVSIQCDPLMEQALMDFYRFMPVVHWKHLSVEMIPRDGASRTLMSGRYAWIPGPESYPASWKEMSAFPTVANVVAGPKFFGGMVEPVVMPASWAYGNQTQIKPLPMIGGSPKLAMRFRLVRMSLMNAKGESVAEVADGAPCYNLYLNCEIIVAQ